MLDGAKYFGFETTVDDTPPITAEAAVRDAVELVMMWQAGRGTDTTLAIVTHLLGEQPARVMQSLMLMADVAIKEILNRSRQADDVDAAHDLTKQIGGFVMRKYDANWQGDVASSLRGGAPSE